jgi:demethylsterigmatocystin 6-O-methyltransferase
MPLTQAMPAFFAENNYNDVTDNAHTPFQKAFDTKLTAFEWLFQHPKFMEAMHKTMSALQGTEWTEQFTLLDTEVNKVPETAPEPEEKPFLVDIGGSHGHQCIELVKKYPNLLGRLVMQDLPMTVESLAPIEGVKVEAYDFFQEQPVKGSFHFSRTSPLIIDKAVAYTPKLGAKFYYLRRIMHDWPDEKAAQILKNTAAAMGPDSRILIDDVVMPGTGANWQATMADLSMMILAGRERSLNQYENLAKSAELRVEMVHSYAASTYTAIVVLVKE